MAWLSLAFTALFGIFGLGIRAWLHKRRTGRSPLRRGAGPRGGLAVVGVTLAFTVGPIADLVFGVRRIVQSAWLSSAGVIVVLVALAGVLWFQVAMGDSLRIGVDPTERTPLVTSGPFRWLRNPIYTAMFCFVAGTAMLVPNLAAIVAAVALFFGEEFQVRRVEEPYLSATHGADYRSYAATVGRFVPGVGKLDGRDP